MALQAAYNFEEAGGDVLDVSGNGRGFSLTGTTARTAAGGGYTYGGTVPGAKGLTQTNAETQTGPPITGLNTAARTVMAWVRLTGTEFNGWFMEYHRATENTGVWGFLMLFSVFRFRAKDSSNTSYDITIPADPGNWHHLAATHDGATLRVYRDGTLLGSAPMGAAVWAGGTVRVFDAVGANAVLDEVRTFDEALDQPTIAALMNTPVSGTEPVENLSGTVSLTVDLTGTLETPAASVEDLSGSLALTVALNGTLDVPTPSVPDLTGTLALDLATAGTLVMPPATIPDLAGSLAVVLGMHGILRDPSAPTSGTYSAVVDRATYSALIDDRQYTAIVEA